MTTAVEMCGLCSVPAGEGVCVTCAAVRGENVTPIRPRVLYDSGPSSTLAEHEDMIQKARIALRKGKRAVVSAGGTDVALGIDPTRPDGRYWARCSLSNGRTTRPVIVEGYESSLDALSALAERVHAMNPRRRR